MPQKDISCVYEGLFGSRLIYISNLVAAKDPKMLECSSNYSLEMKIGAILTVAKGAQLQHPNSIIQSYLYLAVEDKEEFNLETYLDTCYDFIEANHKRTNVLIHCVSGVSRSVAVLLAFLIRKFGYSLQAAFALVKRRRPNVVMIQFKANPNPGFIKILENYSIIYSNNNVQKYISHNLSSIDRVSIRSKSRKSNSLHHKMNNAKQKQSNLQPALQIPSKVEVEIPQDLEYQRIKKTKTQVEIKIQQLQQYYQQKTQKPKLKKILRFQHLQQMQSFPSTFKTRSADITLNQS